MTNRRHAAIVVMAAQLAKAHRANNQRAVKENTSYLVALAEALPAEELAELEAMFVEPKKDEAANG